MPDGNPLPSGNAKVASSDYQVVKEVYLRRQGSWLCVLTAQPYGRKKGKLKILKIPGIGRSKREAKSVAVGVLQLMKIKKYVILKEVYRYQKKKKFWRCRLIILALL